MTPAPPWMAKDQSIGCAAGCWATAGAATRARAAARGRSRVRVMTAASAKRGLNSRPRRRKETRPPHGQFTLNPCPVLRAVLLMRLRASGGAQYFGSEPLGRTDGGGAVSASAGLRAGRTGGDEA